jgi:membrane-associated phospholipid phosphatase
MTHHLLVARLSRNIGCGVALAAFALAPITRPVTAQSAPPSAPHDSTIFRASDAALLGVTTAGALLLFQRDQAITEWFRQSALQNNAMLKNTLTGARLFGDPGSLAISAAMWAGGKAFHDKNTARDGQMAFEAVAVSSAVTFVLKGAVGRARPYADSTNAHNFAFGRGIGGDGAYQSFPSGHATAAFAFASAITASVARRSPRYARIIGPILYTAAALTAASRVYDHKHWASDVLLGAGIGTVGGLMTVRWHDRHP